jgi:prepilin peptidase CpaA
MTPHALGWIADGLLAACVVACAATEAARRTIYNAVVYPAIAAGLALAFARGGAEGLQTHALALAAGAGIPLLFFAAGAIGGGDVKLLGACGALGGLPFILYATGYSFAVGALMAVGVMIARRGALRGAAGAARLVASSVAPVPVPGEDRAAGRIALPFGVAIAAGVIARLVEQRL